METLEGLWWEHTVVCIYVALWWTGDLFRCHSSFTLRQLVEAPAEPCDPGSRNKRVLKSHGCNLTVDVAAVFSEELQSVRVVVLHWLRHVDDVGVSAVISACRQTGTGYSGQEFNLKRRVGRGGWGYIQHVKLAKVSVNEACVLEHLPHVLHHLQVELAGLGLRQRGVL